MQYLLNLRSFIVTLAMLLVCAVPVWAQNAIYTRLGTGVTWTDTGGDEQLDLGDGVNGLNDAVACGSYHDWGVDPRPTYYYVEVDLDGYDGAPTVGEGVNLYISMGQTTSLFTGPITLADTTDVVGSTDDLPNWMFVGSILNTSTAAADNLGSSFFVHVAARYWAPCTHNNNADANADLLTTADSHEIHVYPVYFEVQ